MEHIKLQWEGYNTPRERENVLEETPHPYSSDSRDPRTGEAVETIEAFQKDNPMVHTTMEKRERVTEEKCAQINV